MGSLIDMDNCIEVVLIDFVAVVRPSSISDRTQLVDRDLIAD